MVAIYINMFPKKKGYVVLTISAGGISGPQTNTLTDVKKIGDSIILTERNDFKKSDMPSVFDYQYTFVLNKEDRCKCIFTFILLFLLFFFSFYATIYLLLLPYSQVVRQCALTALCVSSNLTRATNLFLILLNIDKGMDV